MAPGPGVSGLHPFLASSGVLNELLEGSDFLHGYTIYLDGGSLMGSFIAAALKGFGTTWESCLTQLIFWCANFIDKHKLKHVVVVFDGSLLKKLKPSYGLELLQAQA